jgi:hypothetical protein
MFTFRPRRPIAAGISSGVRLGRGQAGPSGAESVCSDGRRRHRGRRERGSSVCSFYGLEATGVSERPHLGDDDGARRTGTNLLISSCHVAASTVGIPNRPRLGDAACGQRPATSAVGDRRWVAPRGARLLRDAASRRAADRRSAGPARSLGSTRSYRWMAPSPVLHQGPYRLRL